jgi:8-oxo-dGTP diphosphatase
MRRLRSAVVIVEDGRVALIKRVNERGTYYLFPGGGVEAGETLQAAAIREAMEELGVTVHLDDLLCIVHFGEDEQYYFAAHISEGEFGTGKGEELSLPAESEAGSYEPVWLSRTELTQYEYDIYPVHLARLIAANLLDSVEKPMVVKEASA